MSKKERSLLDMVHTCFDFGCCVKLHHVSQDGFVIPEKKTSRTWATESVLLQQVQILSYTCAHTHKRACTHAHMHARTHVCMHTHTHTHTHTYVRAHTYTHTHIHMCVHTHTHTHTHTYAHTQTLQTLQLTVSNTDSLSIHSTRTQLLFPLPTSKSVVYHISQRFTVYT